MTEIWYPEPHSNMRWPPPPPPPGFVSLTVFFPSRRMDGCTEARDLMQIHAPEMEKQFCDVK